MVIAGAIAVQIYRIIAQWAEENYAVQSYVVMAQGLDDDTVTRIGNWLAVKKESGALRNPDYKVLHAELLAAFPLIASSSWSRLVPEWLNCRVVGAQPLFIVNDSYVAADNGRLYPQSFFPTMPRTEKKVTISREWLDEDVFENQPYAFLTQLTPSFLSVYEVAYANPALIVVWPKESLDLPHHCVCIVDQRTVSLLPDTVVLMSLCQGLKDERDDADDDRVCLLDFRFPGRLIRKCITQKESIHLQRV